MNTKGVAEEGRRWWGEQQQPEERVSERSPITSKKRGYVKKILQHVGSESLVSGAEPEQVPFCSGSVAEALKKVKEFGTLKLTLV